MRDDPFDTAFFREQREKREREREENAGLFRRVFGWGLAAAVVLVVLNLLIIVATVAVVLWVALTILQHFGVLMLFVGVVL